MQCYDDKTYEDNLLLPRLLLEIAFAETSKSFAFFPEKYIKSWKIVSKIWYSLKWFKIGKQLFLSFYRKKKELNLKQLIELKWFSWINSWNNRIK